MRLVLLVVFSVVAACGRWGDVSFADEGEVCFSQTLAAVSVEVSAPDCLSSSCTRNVEASCSAAVEGTRIEITSDFSWEEKDRGTCTLDCGSATAACSVGPLADGTYTVVHGEEEFQLVVPLEMQGCPL